MALKLVTAADPIVSLSEIKQHVRAYDFTDDDSYLESLVATVTGWIDGKDGWLGRCIGAQTWDYVSDAFPTGAGPLGGGIRIPLPPLQSVTYVRYIDPDTGLEVTLTSGTDYEVDTFNEPGWVMPSTDGWPAAMETINAIRVRFIAGYSSVPPAIKHGVKLMAGHLYENREASTMDRPSELPLGVSALLMPLRYWPS